MAADLLIKICGITNLEDAQRAVDFGADALGFVFVPASPRYITVDTAASIISRLPSALGKVGVFVNESRQNIHSVIDRTGITHVQLHGDESPEDTTQFSLPVWKAFRVSPAFAVSSLSPYHPSAFLLDAFSNDAYGGTGRTFDWNLAVQAKQFGRIILSGGLNPQNAAEAVQRVRPYGIDVNSGVEDSPGKKDKRKLQELFSVLKNVGV